MLVRPDRHWHIGHPPDRIYSRCGWTPYAGMSVRGRPLATVVGGRVAHREAD